MERERIKEILMLALDAEDAERGALIERECSGDREAGEEVRALLAAHRSAGMFLEEPTLPVGGGVRVSAGSVEDDVPMEVGGRRVIRKLGEGGFGVVYLAEQTGAGAPAGGDQGGASGDGE